MAAARRAWPAGRRSEKRGGRLQGLEAARPSCPPLPPTHPPRAELRSSPVHAHTLAGSWKLAGFAYSSPQDFQTPNQKAYDYSDPDPTLLQQVTQVGARCQQAAHPPKAAARSDARWCQPRPRLRARLRAAERLCRLLQCATCGARGLAMLAKAPVFPRQQLCAISCLIVML